MKKVVKASVIVAVLSFVLSTFAMAGMPSPGDVNIKEILAVKIKDNGTNYLMDVTVTFNNTGQVDLRFKDSRFAVKLKSKEVKTFYLGQGPVELLDIPKGSGEGAASTKTTVTLDIGPMNSPETMKKLLTVFNIFGQPKEYEELQMNFAGTGHIGGRVDQGWVYQTGMVAELVFQPSITREVLMQ